MKMPLKLERLVNENYDGNVKAFVEDTKKYADKLRDLQREIYDQLDQLPKLHNPLVHVHNLRKYWTGTDEKNVDRVERLEEIGKAVLNSDYGKKLLALVQRSVIYKYEGDLYALPFKARLSEAGSAANGGFIARTISMVLPPLMRFRTPITALGAICGYAIAKKRDEEKNPFEELGKKLEEFAEEWSTEKEGEE